MGFLPAGMARQANSRGSRALSRRRRAWARAAALAGSAGLLVFMLPGAVASARPAGTPSSLQSLIAQANALSNQIDSLSQQYDGLEVQYQQALTEAAAAKKTAARDEKALAAGQAAVAQIADENYMTGGVNPTIQLLESGSPQTILNQSSLLTELDHQQDGKISLLAQAEAAANRAKQTAAQEESLAAKLAGEAQAKVTAMQAKQDKLNSQAFAQAMSIFEQTGSYPPVSVTGDTVGVEALRAALTRLGDPYVWGGAGPDDFDCSGLVQWAYAQVGISLVHYTVSQWSEGVHVSVSQLEPGDLVFFFADISHVGIYMGDGYMVDAPTFGQPVQVQPVLWSDYVGAVAIA